MTHMSKTIYRSSIYVKSITAYRSITYSLNKIIINNNLFISLKERYVSIFIVDSLQENEMAFDNITNSWFINDHRYMSSLPPTSPSEIPFSQLMVLQMSCIGVLPINHKKFYVYFMNRITLRSLFLLLALIIPTICKMDSQK